MAYIGQAPINGFHAKQSLTGDGSTVTFTLDQTVATETGINSFCWWCFTRTINCI